MTPKKFLEDKDYEHKEIWELPYADTSEDEDDESTSSGEEESDEEESEEEDKVKKEIEKEVQVVKEQVEDKEEKVEVEGKEGKEQKKPEDDNQVKMKFKKDAPGATGDQVPTLTKQLKRRLNDPQNKKPQQIKYQYAYVPGQEKPMKTAIVRKVSERKGPSDLIDLLITQKKGLYDRETRLRQI